MIFDLLCPCPIRPDIDCISGAVGYAEFMHQTQGLNASAWLCGVPDGGAQFYIDRYAGQFPLVTDTAVALQAKNYALIDFSTKNPLPDGFDCARVATVIDHRFVGDPQQDFPNAHVQLQAVGAAASLITELFMTAGLTPSEPAAAMLLGGIHSNTIGFQSQLTSPRDRAAFDWLLLHIPNGLDLLAAQDTAHRDSIIADLPNQLVLEAIEKTLPDGTPYQFSQLEFAGALDVWQNKQNNARTILHSWAQPAMLNWVDTAAGIGIVCSTQPDWLATLAMACGVPIKDDTIMLSPPMLRKQLQKLLNENYKASA